MNLIDELTRIRDTARTGLPAGGMTKAQWDRRCLNVVARDLTALIVELDNLDHQPESLSFLAKWSGVKRDTLLKAAQAGRLEARQSGTTWLSTRQAVEQFKARYVPKPRNKGEK